jgi:hypothetical protein
MRGKVGGEILTSLRLRRLGAGVAPKYSGEPAGPLLRFELMVANLLTFATEGIWLYRAPVSPTKPYTVCWRTSLRPVLSSSTSARDSRVSLSLCSYT